jgi:hypothetical protein
MKWLILVCSLAFTGLAHAELPGDYQGDLQEDNQVETLQHGSGTKGYPYTCYAYDSAGAGWYGNGTNVDDAKSAAMWWCKNHSDHRDTCHITSCHQNF